MQETKRAPDQRKLATREHFFFSKQTCLMEKLIALLTRQKRLRMNGKMITLIFFELYKVHIKIRTILFP